VFSVCVSCVFFGYIRILKGVLRGLVGDDRGALSFKLTSPFLSSLSSITHLVKPHKTHMR